MHGFSFALFSRSIAQHGFIWYGNRNQILNVALIPEYNVFIFMKHYSLLIIFVRISLIEHPRKVLLK